MPRTRIFRGCAGWALALTLCASAAPAWAYECWQGWGYLVDPQTNAYKSGQSLYVTDGSVNWTERRWVRLFRIDPASGLRVKDGKPIHIRPRRPVQKGSRKWADVVEDVVEVRNSEWAFLVRLTRIAPSPNARSLNDESPDGHAGTPRARVMHPAVNRYPVANECRMRTATIFARAHSRTGDDRAARPKRTSGHRPDGSCTAGAHAADGPQG